MPLREMVGDLESVDPAVRVRAVERLRRLGGEEAAGALVLLLGDPDATVQAKAAEALGAIGPDAVGPVFRFLASWEGGPGRHIPELLGRLGRWLGSEPDVAGESGVFGVGVRPVAHACDFLVKHADDPSPEVRAAIATALGEMRSERAIAPLLELLRDLHDSVRIAAARALGQAVRGGFGVRPEEMRKDTISPGGSGRVSVSRVVDALLDEVGDDNPAVRMAAVDALGRIGDRRAVELLARISADDASADVRSTARTSLRNVSVKTVEPLIQALEHDDLPERIRAVSQLLECGRASIVPLSELLVSGNPVIRSAAAEVLGAIGDPAAVDALSGALFDDDARVRLAVVSALGRIKHLRSAEYLVQALEDQDGKIAAAAANGLEALGELSVEPAFLMMNHESAEVRIRVMDVLGRLKHKGACERLVSGLTENTVWVRIVAAQALGEICESRAAPALIEALKDRDAVVRAMAAEALGKLRDFRATMPLLARLQDESNLVRIHSLRALGHIGNPAAAPFLVHALDDPVPGLRAAAIEGLTSLPVTRVLGRLRRMARLWPLSREPREVKQAARAAIPVLQAALEQEKALIETTVKAK